MLANGDNVLANSVRERRSKNLSIRCKLEESAYSTVGIACGLLKRPCNCNGIAKNVKFIVTMYVGTDVYGLTSGYMCMVLWEIRILTGQLGEHRLKMEAEPWTVGGGGGGRQIDLFI